MAIARNTLLVLTSQLVAVVASLASSIVTARYLGPGGRGLLALVNISLNMLLLLSGFGLSYSLTYFVAKERVDVRQALGVAVLASLLLGALGVTVSAALYWLLAGSVLRGVPFLLFVFGIIGLPALIFVELWTTIRIARSEFEVTTVYQIIVILVTLGMTVLVLMAFHGGVWGLVIASTATSVVFSLGLLVLSIRKDGISFDLRGVRHPLMKYGLKVYAGSLVNSVYLRLDAYILNAFSTKANVGQYSMAVTINEKLWLVDSALNQAVLPEVISKGERESAKLVALACRTLLLFTGVVALALGLSGHWVMGLLYGKEFLPAVLPLQLLLPGTVVYSASKPLATYFSGQLGKPGTTSMIAAGTALASVAVYLVFVPRLAAVGAALGSTIVYAGVFMVLLRMFSSESGMPVRDVLIPNAEDMRIYWSFVTRIAARIKGAVRNAFGR